MLSQRFKKSHSQKRKMFVHRIKKCKKYYQKIKLVGKIWQI